MLFFKSNTFYFFLLFIISFGIRLFFLAYFRFDGFYGQDSYAYYEFSRLFLGSITNFRLPAGLYWPIGFYSLTSFFSIFTAGNIGLAGLLVSLNSGALCPAVTFMLADELFKEYEFKKRISLFAGLIICFSPLHVNSSVVVMSDSAGLLFLLFSMLFLAKYFNEPSLRNIVLSFSFFSAALLTRYAAAIAAAVIFSCLLYIRHSGRIPKPGPVLKHTVISFLAAAVIFAPQLYYIIEHGIPYLQFEGETGTWASGWDPLNYFKSDFTTADGTMHYRFPNFLFFMTPLFHPACLSAFGIFFLLGAVKLFRSKIKWVSLFTFSWFFSYYIYLSGNPFQSLRYTLSFLPPLAVISAFGLANLKLNKKMMYALLSSGLLMLAGYSFYNMSGFIEKKQEELRVVSWVDSNIPEGSVLFAFEVTAAVNHYSRIKPEEFFFFNEQRLKDKIDSSSSGVYFILPVEKLRSQWKGLPVERNMDFLLSNYNLRNEAKISYYTVFKLERR